MHHSEISFISIISKLLYGINRDGEFIENFNSQKFILPISKMQHTLENS